jgi:hypothetical protein
MNKKNEQMSKRDERNGKVVRLNKKTKGGRVRRKRTVVRMG